MATRDSVPPTLIRRTPSSARSFTVKPNGPALRKLIGFGATAFTVAAMCSRVLMPGEYRQSAPASANAFSRRMVSSRSGRLRMKSFRASGEDDVAARLVDRVPGRPHALHGEVEVIERVDVATGVILDRQPGHAGLDAEPDIGSHLVGIIGIAVLEIRIHWDVRRLRDFAAMREHHVLGHIAVGIAVRMGVTRAGCRERLETQPLQIAGGPDVPRVGDDPAAGLVQCAERAAFFGDTS